MERREFIKSSAAFCVLVGSTSLAGCLNYKPLTAEYEKGNLKIKKSDFTSNWAVIKSDRTNTPIFLTKWSEEGYHAVLMECTHKQCEVKPQGNFLVCPCHGSEFSNSGKVLKEPAEHDLKNFETSSDENYIYITLK